MDSNGPVIALVDDDKIFQLTASRTILALQLSRNVLQFENGEEAMKYLADHASEPEKLPDYVFLDINMPFMDGWMFLKEFDGIKPSLAKNLTIYMVSSSIDPRDISRAKTDRNVADYVIKPVSKERFKELLQKAA